MQSTSIICYTHILYLESWIDQFFNFEVLGVLSPPCHIKSSFCLYHHYNTYRVDGIHFFLNFCFWVIITNFLFFSSKISIQNHKLVFRNQHRRRHTLCSICNPYHYTLKINGLRVRHRHHFGHQKDFAQNFLINQKKGADLEPIWWCQIFRAHTSEMDI